MSTDGSRPSRRTRRSEPPPHPSPSRWSFCPLTSHHPPIHSSRWSVHLTLRHGQFNLIVNKISELNLRIVSLNMAQDKQNGTSRCVGNFCFLSGLLGGARRSNQRRSPQPRIRRPRCYISSQLSLRLSYINSGPLNLVFFVPPAAGAGRVECQVQGEVWLRVHDLRIWEDCA